MAETKLNNFQQLEELQIIHEEQINSFPLIIIHDLEIENNK